MSRTGIVWTDARRVGGEVLEAALVERGWDPANPPLFINWTGKRIKEEQKKPLLNASAFTNKLKQLDKLAKADVAVPAFTSLPPTGEGWLGRTMFHKRGLDFTRKRVKPDFWVQRLNFEEEWRLHFFRTKKGNLRLLRSAKRVAKGPEAHPWVRSHSLGWKLSYCGGAPEAMKAVARAAMEALKLDFGAVDIGLVKTQPFVIEVNTCPGLESGTLALYLEQFLERGK